MRVALASQAMQDALQDAIEAAETLPGENTTTQAERGRALTFGEIMALMAVCQADPSPDNTARKCLWTGGATHDNI